MTQTQAHEKAKADLTKGLVMNVADWFEDQAFVDWLNNPDTNVMSWHTKGQPITEYSDVMVLVDPSLSGDGSDDDMPEKFWSAIVQACRDNLSPDPSGCHFTVRLTPMEA